MFVLVGFGGGLWAKLGFVRGSVGVGGDNGGGCVQK